MSKGTDGLFEHYYFRRASYRGGTTQFHALCRSQIVSGARILEIGAGPSNVTSDFLSGLGTLTGVDVSVEITENKALSVAHIYDGTTLPFDDGQFDACVSNYVLEHVVNPRQHFREIRRVLRPGGVFVFRTPNLFHYVALASRALPHAAHRLLANKLRGLGDEGHEPWPTVYKANSRGTIAQLASQSSLRVEACILIEPEPTYGSASKWLFYPMMLYERLVNATEVLADFRAHILGVLRRQAAEPLPLDVGRHGPTVGSQAD